MFQESPFVEHNPDFPHKSNKPFIGFCIDMLEELREKIGFEYTIRLVRDGFYGAMNPKTLEWNGMIKELIDGVRDHFTCSIWLLK